MPNDYDTSAFPLGSTDPRVLYNNSGNEDLFVNDVANQTWVDRPPFNRQRLTIFGMEQEFNAAMAAMGFESTHLTYVDGTPLTVNRPTQLIDRAGLVYSVSLPQTFPLTLTGNWATDAPKLQDVSSTSVRLDLASGATGKGDALLAVKQPTTNSVLVTQHDVNAQTVLFSQYGGKDDDNGTSGTDSTPAMAAIIADFPAPSSATIHFKKSIGGTGGYLFNSSLGNADMSRFKFIFDDGVSFRVVGTNTPLIAPGLKINKPVDIKMSTLGYTYSLSPTPYGELSGKPYTLSAADGEAPQLERLITSAANTFLFNTVSFSTGALSSLSASTDGNFASFTPVPGTDFFVGSVAILPGQEVHSQITLPSNPGQVCAFVQTEGGWVIFSQAAAGTSINRYVFLEGFPIQAATFANPFSSNPAYNFANSQVGVKVHGPRSFSVLLNHVEVARMDSLNLTSDILRAGWGVGAVTNSSPGYISYPMKIRGNRTYGCKQYRVVFVGDSTTDKVNPFSSANHMIRVASGVGGIQVSSVLNQAVAGQTAVQQRDIVVGTDYAALGGFDYMFIDPGINDIAGGSTAEAYVQAIDDIINHCVQYNIIPIVDPPAMFYDQSAALPFGQTGQNSSGAANGSNYRELLLRKLAERDVQVGLLPIQDMGAVIPSMLANPLLNKVVQDNVHQSNWGGEIKGMARAKGWIGYLFCRVRKTIGFRVIKTSWIDAAQQATYGNLAKPAFGIREGVFYMGNVMNIPTMATSPVTPPYGTKIFQLPATYGPPTQRFIWVNAGAATGVWTAQVLLRIDQDGSVYTQTPVAGMTYLEFTPLTWPLAY